MDALAEIKIKRLSAGTLFRLCLLGIIPCVFLGILFGLFSLLGFNTVPWGGKPVFGLGGLLLGVAIGLVTGFAVASLNFLLMGLGMVFLSMMKTLKIRFYAPEKTPGA